ncbi:MAG: NAD(P)/FAD-dependent oxidoreductase [Pseudomonadota bacterium]
MTIDPDRLRDALEEADLRALLLTVYQLTGEEKWLTLQPRRDTRILAPEDAGLSAAEQGELRAAAFDLLSTDAARTPVVADPSDDELHALMNLCLGEHMAPEYVPMMREELGLASRDVQWREEPSKVRKRVLIVGAGVNGIALARQLQGLAIPFEIVEKNADVGGTWLENRYPGCGVDTPNHAYSFSFGAPFPWTSYFSRRDQILSYIKRTADDLGLRERIRFNTEVLACDWREERCCWSVHVRTPAGESTLEAEVLVSAIGHFNQPQVPAIAGLDRFGGQAFHTARWPEDLDLTGKRVAVVGTGASSMQLVSAIAEQVSELTIFQRTPQWARPIPRAREHIGAGAQWLMQTVPLYARWFRFLMFWRYGDGLLPFLRYDPAWPDAGRSLNRGNDKHRREMEAYIAEQLAERPELIEACTPRYPPYAKRMLIDFGWYRALNNDHVRLIPHGVERVEGSTVVAGTERVEADVLVLATGFDMTSMASRLNVTGVNGDTLAARWAPDDPKAYLGMHVPGFPNFAMLLGPSSGLGHGGSAMFVAECQARYVARWIADLHERGLASADVTEAAYDRFVERVDREHADLIWTHPGMETYYRNSVGRVFSIMPWRLVDLWQMTRAVDWQAFDTASQA